ncbi:MAG: DUF493 domain-containing protein [Desulfobulbus propionicus]|nr:MAG: DUF493 domain-containing protein [Desulfobulbus propionicus]
MKKTINHLQGQKLDISYPCPWQYTIIGWDRTAVTKAVAAIAGEEGGYILTDSRSSSKGKYISMNLELILASEEMRLSLYRQLSEHAAVKLVL